jgi:hypothetical protein
MARVQSQKTRQFLLVTGDPLGDNELPDKIELFNEDGDPLMLGTEGVRTQQAEPSAVLDPGQTTSDVWTAQPGLRLFRIQTNRPARVRVYPTEAFQAADLPRPIGTKPRGNHGRLLEVVTTSTLLDLTLTPVVDMVSKEAFFKDYYVSVTNLDSVAGAVEITYHYIRTE